MKRLFACALIVMLLTTLLSSCDLWNKNERVSCEIYENGAVFTLDYFEGSYAVKLSRTVPDDGTIYYRVVLEYGCLTVNYRDVGSEKEEQKLSEFTADDEMPVVGSGGYIEGDVVEILFGTLSPVKGEIYIAFTEDALNTVEKNYQEKTDI